VHEQSTLRAFLRVGRRDDLAIEHHDSADRKLARCKPVRPDSERLMHPMIVVIADPTSMVQPPASLRAVGRSGPRLGHARALLSWATTSIQ
jgi:hypothetical protein